MIIDLYASKDHQLIRIDEIDTDNEHELNEMIDYIVEMVKKGYTPEFVKKEV
jgi:hypothetical protein